MADFDNVTPKKIGNFNIPKNVIECKIDTLAFLELLLRKNICTWEEVEEVREVVVMHMNVMFPELQLSYTTPAPLNEQAPLTPPDQPQKPLFYNAPPPELETVNPPVSQPAVAKASEAKPMFQNAQPPKIMNAAPRPSIQPLKQQATAEQTPPTATSAAPAQTQPFATTEGEATPVEAETPATPTPATQAPPVQAQAPKPGITPLPGAPRPMMPNSGPPRILNNPPRKNI